MTTRRCEFAAFTPGDLHPITTSPLWCYLPPVTSPQMKSLLTEFCIILGSILPIGLCRGTFSTSF